MTALPRTTHDAAPILPGATLGVFGSGQLGRMFAVAASRLGYRVHVYSPYPDSPAGQVAHCETVAGFEDVTALAAFGRAVDVATLEFENVPAKAVEIVNQFTPVRPSLEVLRITQNRLREKEFLAGSDLPCAPFASVHSLEELSAVITRIGVPAVLKTADSGYDGKGQVKIERADEASSAWDRIHQRPAVLEAWIDHQQECSVLVARSTAGATVTCGPIANDHWQHILDVSRFPASDLDAIAPEADRLARHTAESLDFVGICCVELFLTQQGQLLVNEIAPRPHNSGHLTIEACVTSQFEQQVRAVCGLPLGTMRPRCPAAMANLLGDLWATGEPDWLSVLASPDAHLHLYGKYDAKSGRKMGHITVLAESSESAAKTARSLRSKLSQQ